MMPVKDSEGLLEAIEKNDCERVRDILCRKFKDRTKVRQFILTEMFRSGSMEGEFTEVPFLLSATLTDPSILNMFVKEYGVDVNTQFKNIRMRHVIDCDTVLFVAVGLGLDAIVKALLEHRVDVNIFDQRGQTPLHLSVSSAHYGITKRLLTVGADVNAKDSLGNSALHMATVRGHSELVKLLMKYEAHGSTTDHLGMTPLCISAREGHTGLVQLFAIIYGLDPNVNAVCGKAPIHFASSEANSDAVMTLLEFCKTDVNLCDSEGNTPLHNCFIHRYDVNSMKPFDEYKDTLNLLLKHGADVNKKNVKGETPFHLANDNGYTQLTDVIIKAGYVPNKEDGGDVKAMEYSTESNKKHNKVSTLRKTFQNKQDIPVPEKPIVLEKPVPEKPIVLEKPVSENPVFERPAARGSLSGAGSLYPPFQRSLSRSSLQAPNDDNESSSGKAVDKKPTKTNKPQPKVRKTISVDGIDKQGMEPDDAPKSGVGTKLLASRIESYQGNDSPDNKSASIEVKPKVRSSLKAKKSGKKTKMEFVKSTNVEPPEVEKRQSMSSYAEGSEANLTSWLEEQARLMKEKDISDQSVPMAQSTPPPVSKLKKQELFETKDNNDDASKKKPPPPPKTFKKLKTSISANTVTTTATAPVVQMKNVIETESNLNESSGSLKEFKPVPKPRQRKMEGDDKDRRSSSDSVNDLEYIKRYARTRSTKCDAKSD